MFTGGEGGSTRRHHRLVARQRRLFFKENDDTRGRAANDRPSPASGSLPLDGPRGLVGDVEEDARDFVRLVPHDGLRERLEEGEGELGEGGRHRLGRVDGPQDDDLFRDRGVVGERRHRDGALPDGLHEARLDQSVRRERVGAPQRVEARLGTAVRRVRRERPRGRLRRRREELEDDAVDVVVAVDEARRERIDGLPGRRRRRRRRVDGLLVLVSNAHAREHGEVAVGARIALAADRAQRRDVDVDSPE
mmetsp:Transcript_2466/g.9435  ORF Transcript_2466/g.9435 Transcript_2466/m.9435 type:complete len:249 (-) Transcript_2466:986-1732(-)